MIIGSFLAFANPSLAQAAPALDNAVVTVQSVTQLGITMWQIKGTGSATGLPAGTTSASATFTFQKKVNGAWIDMFDASQASSANPVAGKINFDTGFLNFGPAPVARQVYRLKLNGNYTSGNPAMISDLAGIFSNEIIPVP